MSTSRVVFKSLVLACAGMVVVFYAVGLLLADEWQVATTRTLTAPPARVAALVGDLSTWSDWASMDVNLGPQTHRSVRGEPGTAGHALQWSGQRGTATLTFRTVTPTAIDYDFTGEGPQQQPMQWQSSGRIEWHAEGDTCRVRWHDEGHWGNLAGRWMGWFGAMQVHTQQMQSTSLEGLAERLEARPLAAPGAADTK